MERRGLRLHPVGIAGPSETDPWCHVEDDGQVGDQVLSRPQAQVSDLVLTEFAGSALIGDRGVQVPVAEDHGPAGHGRPDQLRSVLGTSRSEQERLSPGGHPVAADPEQDLPDGLTDRRCRQARA